MANLLPDEIDKVDQVLTPWVDRPDQVVEVDAQEKVNCRLCYTCILNFNLMVKFFSPSIVGLCFD